MVSTYGFIQKVIYGYIDGSCNEWLGQIGMIDQEHSEPAEAARAFEEIRQLRRKARLYHEILQGGEGTDPEGRAQAAFQDVTARLLACLFAFSEDGHEDTVVALLAAAGEDGKGR